MFAKKGKLNSPSISENANAPVPTTLLHRFPDLSVHHLDIHPVKPWILFADRRGAVYLYDWEQHDVLWSFSVNGMYETKKEEISLYKVNYNNIHLPDWYDESLLRAEKMGDIESVRLFDEDIVHWKLHDKLAEDSSTKYKEFSLNRKISPRLKKKFVLGKTPKCIVLQSESRIIMLRYDEISSGLFFFDEIKSSQLEGKLITSMEFLYSHPMIAVGCSDGVIRLWNFKTKTITKNVNSATKPIIKMQAVARDDPMNSYPLLFALSQDGNLAAHNLDKNIPEYKITNTGTISDFIFHNNEIISVLSNNTVTVRDIRGNVTRQAILPKAKVSNAIVCPVTTCGCIPNWYLFSNYSNKIIQAPPTMGEATFTEFEVATSKMYTVQQHPLQPNLVFIGAANGLFAVRLDATRFPSGIGGYLKSKIAPQQNRASQIFATPNSPPPLQDLSFQNSSLAPVKNERFVYYMQENNVMKRIVNSSGPKDIYTEPVIVMGLQKAGNVTLDISHSGRFLSVLWDNDNEYDIYRTDNWHRVGNGTGTECLVWSSTDDRFAIVKGSTRLIALYQISNFEVQVVSEALTTMYTVKSIFGGALLGVLYTNSPDNLGFQFLSWNGEESRGGLLPKPNNVLWDPLSANCLMIYDDCFAVFTSSPQFKLICYVNEKLENAKWFNSTLFAATMNEIKCIFPSTRRIYSVTLASFDIAGYSNVEQSEEDSLDPIPQARPKGPITFIDIVADDLVVLDSLGELHRISLGHPALKFRLLVAAGILSKAIDWLPHIPYELHDNLSDFLVSYGAVREACGVGSVSAGQRFQMCLDSGMIREGLECLRLVEGADTYRLYLRLGNVAEMKNEDPELIEGIYTSATEIDPKGYSALMIFLAKRKKEQQLSLLQERLEKLEPSVGSPLLLLYATLTNNDELRLKHLNNPALVSTFNMKRGQIGTRNDLQGWSDKLRKNKNIAPVEIKEVDTTGLVTPSIHGRSMSHGF